MNSFQVGMILEGSINENSGILRSLYQVTKIEEVRGHKLYSLRVLVEGDNGMLRAGSPTLYNIETFQLKASTISKDQFDAAWSLSAKG